MRTVFAPEYIDGTVVLRSGEEIPLRQIFERNPGLLEAGDGLTFRCPQHPEVKSFAEALFTWNPATSHHDLTLLRMGASATFLARCDA
jgi:hypothetical protein